jgi:hypothetical protein
MRVKRKLVIKILLATMETHTIVILKIPPKVASEYLFLLSTLLLVEWNAGFLTILRMTHDIPNNCLSSRFI